MLSSPRARVARGAQTAEHVVGEDGPGDAWLILAGVFTRRIRDMASHPAAPLRGASFQSSLFVTASAPWVLSTAGTIPVRRGDGQQSFVAANVPGELGCRRRRMGECWPSCRRGGAGRGTGGQRAGRSVETSGDLRSQIDINCRPRDAALSLRLALRVVLRLDGDRDTMELRAHEQKASIDISAYT